MRKYTFIYLKINFLVNIGVIQFFQNFTNTSTKTEKVTERVNFLHFDNL